MTLKKDLSYFSDVGMKKSFIVCTFAGSMLLNYVPQIFYRVLKVRLLIESLHVSLIKCIYNYAYVFDMLFRRRRVNENSVYIDILICQCMVSRYHQYTFEKFMELFSLRKVCKRTIISSIYSKGCFFSVRLFNEYMMKFSF